MIQLILLCTLSFNIFANDFEDFFSKVESFRADFTQEINGKTTSGVLYFSRPKLLKWHTTKPDEIVLLLNDKQITYYDVWLQSANIVSYKKHNLIEIITTNPKNLAQLPKFIVSKNNINYYELDEIFFGFKNSILQEIISNNNLGQEIYVRLDNLQQNIDLSSEFTINFPTEVDVMME